MLNCKNMASLNKYISFGTQKTQMNIKFAWEDSFNRQKVESNNALLAQVSSQYNYATCLARRGCYMELGGDGIKQASKLFQ
jgi:hypothetical protein